MKYFLGLEVISKNLYDVTLRVQPSSDDVFEII
jgi:hypothetical protein